jgi:hypothetical protein
VKKDNNNAILRLSSFAEQCISGRYDKVRQTLERHSIRKGKNWNVMIELLETRATVLRLSPLLLVFCMLHKIGIVISSRADPSTKSVSSRNHASNQEPWIKYIEQLEENLVKVVFELLKYGASPIAKDICGRTVCFYGASIYATSRSLLATTMCINAAISCHFFGREIILQGFDAIPETQRKEMRNGMRGLAGGYQADTGRRIVFLFGQKTSVAVLNGNISLATTCGNDDLCPPDQAMFNLCNVQDRLGHVCLTEVCGSKRKDVLSYLLDRHDASIDLPDWSGQTIRRQSFIIAMNPASKSNELLDHEILAARTIVTKAIKRAREVQKQIDHTCTACRESRHSCKQLHTCQRW